LFLFLAPALSAETKQQRKSSPFAPSLPQLTDKEEEAIDRTVDRFILFDTGRLQGEDGKKAVRDFQKLGPEAIFGLIRGINRAAQLDASCPTLTIGKKIAPILRSTKDLELLEYARENIGAGVTRTRHGGALRDLRVVCMLRKRVVVMTTPKTRDQPLFSGRRSQSSLQSLSTLRSMPVSELSRAVFKAHGPRLRQLMSELVLRDGDDVVRALASAAATRDREVGPLGRSALVRHLSRQSRKEIKEKLKDDRVAVRAAAAQVVGKKRYPLGAELIDLLSDPAPDVRKAAHQALIKMARGKDYGPKGDRSDAERAEATKKWRAWWDRQDK
jgi:hypothetical protein